MKCKVLFLGAGASVGAGYPLCGNIFEYFEKMQYRLDRDDWNRFNQFRKTHSAQFENLNVEKFFTKLEKLISDNTGNVEEREYKPILVAISRMIFDSFGFNNDDYKNLKKKNTLNYVENMVLSSDYIITLNWDNLCEFILSDHNLWFPTDGYGITINLIGTRNNPPTIQKLLFPRSKVIMLKLHGSMGWKLNEPDYCDINYNPDTHKDKLFLTDYNFLNHIPKLKKSCIKFNPSKITDDNAPDLGDNISDPCVIYPSHNKPYVKFPVLEPIWNKAKEVLEKATEVVFVGYSLPDEDKNIRKLINVLNNRINSGTVAVKCIIGQKNDQSNETAERYQHLLGNNIEIIYDNAEVYFTRQSQRF